MSSWVTDRCTVSFGGKDLKDGVILTSRLSAPFRVHAGSLVGERLALNTKWVPALQGCQDYKTRGMGGEDGLVGKETKRITSRAIWDVD